MSKRDLRKSSRMPEWLWHALDKKSVFHGLGSLIDGEWAQTGMSLLAARTGRMVHRCAIQGMIHSKEDKLAMIAELKAMGGRSIFDYYSDEQLLSDEKFLETSPTLVWPEMMADMSLYSDGKIRSTVSLLSLNFEQLRRATKSVRKYVKPNAKEKGSIYAVMPSGTGYEIRRVGQLGKELERGNYSEEVLKKYDFAVRDLQSPDPRGRMVILSGKQGTGKSHLVYAMLAALDSATVVMIPTAMVRELSGPVMLDVLLRGRSQLSMVGPMVFLVEDGDGVIVQRRAENMSDIAGVLNATDGPIGRLLDGRLIVTTNAQDLEIDPAVKRNGRLSVALHVGPLPIEKAIQVYKRLMPDTPDDKLPLALRGVSEVTLGDVYSAAWDAGWRESKAVKVTATEE